jgi:hypothetical protein
MTTPPDSWRARRITQLSSELTALTTNIAVGNSMDYIQQQFYYMYGTDRYDKDGWDTEIRSARIAVYTDGNLYRPDTYYKLELATSDVIILYDYQRIEHYNETWQVYIRVPNTNNSNDGSDWIPINNFELIEDVGTDFERELIYILLKYNPEPGFELLKSGYCKLPLTNGFKSACNRISCARNNDETTEPQLGSLLD